MRDKAAARRYAEGFLSYAKDTIGLDKGFEQLSKVKQILSANPELKKFLENLEITYAEKSELIDKVFEEGFLEEIKELLKLIIKKGRVQQIYDIADYAKVIYYREKGIEKTVLRTVMPLTEESIKKIHTRLEEKLRKKLELEVKLEPELIGGVSVTVGNIVIDGSVKKALSELKEKLMAIKVY